MDKPFQFVLIAKRILRELRALGEAASAGFLGVQKQIETVAKQHQAPKEKEDAAPELRAILNSLQGIQGEQRAGNHSQGRYQHRNLIVSVAGVLVLLGYTFVNYKMLCAMRNANKAASDSFAKTLWQMQAQTGAQQEAAKAASDSIKATQEAIRLDQRAWVGPTEFSLVRFEVGEHFTMTVTIKNNGKTPAVKATSTAAIRCVFR